MKNISAHIWDVLAGNDPKLTTDGHHLFEKNYSAEDVGSMRVAQEYIKPEQGKRLLDIGCGWGKIIVPYAQKGMRTVGIDISKVMLSAAKGYAEDTKTDVGLVNTDAEAIPFKGGSFDIVWSYAVLIHLPKDKVGRILGEVARILDDRGYAYLHFKNSSHILGPVMFMLKLFVRLKKKTPIEVEIRRYSMDEIRSMADKYFDRAEIMSENMEIIPLSIPKNFFSAGEDVLGGIVTDRDTGFVNLLPKPIIIRVFRFYSWFKRLANTRYPFLKAFSKDFIVVLSKPKKATK